MLKYILLSVLICPTLFAMEAEKKEETGAPVLTENASATIKKAATEASTFFKNAMVSLRDVKVLTALSEYCTKGRTLAAEHKAITAITAATTVALLGTGIGIYAVKRARRNAKNIVQSTTLAVPQNSEPNKQ